MLPLGFRDARAQHECVQFARIGERSLRVDLRELHDGPQGFLHVSLLEVRAERGRLCPLTKRREELPDCVTLLSSG